MKIVLNNLIIVQMYNYTLQTVDKVALGYKA